MALSEIKTNIQKWETKDEPQANDSYKIRQIIIKRWNIHIYTHEPSQNSPTKIKYSRLTQQTKEIKNYICQLRTKLKHNLEDKIKEGANLEMKQWKQN